ncbi:unnamed protein product [Didymodactylos carnosus]|uniref:Uncharacterized protein n=1 Tax=Didymodactylos carnosus TaxID=1234261 RepID=A0A814N791_9BILA|nr:unnamed protein product [Didymodactylos carnosus]CAF3854815.1 unnamed protein product [Didymodactylos carnosus]
MQLELIVYQILISRFEQLAEGYKISRFEQLAEGYKEKLKFCKEFCDQTNANSGALILKPQVRNGPLEAIRLVQPSNVPVLRFGS